MYLQIEIPTEDLGSSCFPESVPDTIANDRRVALLWAVAVACAITSV